MCSISRVLVGQRPLSDRVEEAKRKAEEDRRMGYSGSVSGRFSHPASNPPVSETRRRDDTDNSAMALAFTAYALAPSFSRSEPETPSCSPSYDSGSSYSSSYDSGSCSSSFDSGSSFDGGSSF